MGVWTAIVAFFWQAVPRFITLMSKLDTISDSVGRVEKKTDDHHEASEANMADLRVRVTGLDARMSRVEDYILLGEVKHVA